MNACNKERFTSAADALLSTSTDTLRYDTVFTTIGSVTQTLKVYNPNSASLRIDEIGLSGGTASPYTLNINGIVGPSARDITLAAGDSLYLFVTVRINPVQGNLPFLVRDSIRMAWNGNTRFVQLQAYGQNAHFLRNETIRGTRNFVNDLPYVIIDRLTIDTTAQLNIAAGCRIYAENNAPVLVYGTLRAVGTRAEPILFTGSRLDPDYRDLPASWPGIIFRETSKDNVLKFAVIKNAIRPWFPWHRHPTCSPRSSCNNVLSTMPTTPDSIVSTVMCRPTTASSATAATTSMFCWAAPTVLKTAP